MPFTLTADRITLTEKDVTEQIVKFLRARGWRCQRQQSGMFRQNWQAKPGDPNSGLVRVGEKGMADWLIIRPIYHQPRWRCEVFYLEIKAPGRTPKADQLKWLDRRHIEGIEATWCDSFDERGKGKKPFLPWYETRFGG